MNHPPVDRQPSASDHRGHEGQGIRLSVWLSVPFWLGLGLIATLFQA